ncbi:MAG: ThuA domain-containing protein [Planctomycetes bacterium]|nr:ThuA domain-containing protein [Planctomycetota bacterium]
MGASDGRRCGARCLIVLVAALLGVGSRSSCADGAATWRLEARRQTPGDAARDWWRTVATPVEWPAPATAVIVCDVWDQHHCKRAVERLGEFAPRIAAVCDRIRATGGTVIHAPSDCMPAYALHPARKRVVELVAAGLPAGFVPPEAARAGWCSTLAAEADAEYPLDQSLGGEDDDPAEHAAWAAELERLGRNPRMPWLRQSPDVPIDAERDFITDDGAETARVLAARGIRHVILVGVHLNMCVLGRPFGLRRMAEAGRDVVLVRDLTDTMYDPAEWPWVNHFTGTERMIDHVERHVCPTIGSDELLGEGARPFRSPRDARPTVALVIAEDEYGSHRTLPALARRRLGGAFRVVEHHVAPDDPHSIPGLERIAEADVLVLAVRRRGLPSGQMTALRAFLAAGKPVIGIRTASHPFEPRPPVADRETWPEFDRDVFGIEYTGHFGKDVASVIRAERAAAVHPLLSGVPTEGELPQTGSLYRIAPATPATVVLATGAIPGEAPQPVLTELRRPDGGLSIYTSVGHPDDLARPEVERVIVNAVHVAAGVKPPRELDQRDPHDPALRWVSVRKVATAEFPAAADLVVRHTGSASALWARTVVVPDAAAAERGLELVVAPADGGGFAAGALEAWYDGRPLAAEVVEGRGTVFTLPASILTRHRPGVLAVEVAASAVRAYVDATTTLVARDAAAHVMLDRWQIRVGGARGAGFPDMPLPAQFGGPADAVTVLE